MMVCNAGRNAVLVRVSEGSVSRCSMHAENPISNIDEYVPAEDAANCPLWEQCKQLDGQDWQSSSRMGEAGWEPGVFAVDPEGEFFGRLDLSGKNTIFPDKWENFFNRIAGKFRKCLYRLEGLEDPADYECILPLVEHLGFLGDRLIYRTDFTSRTTRLVDVLAKARADSFVVLASLDPARPDFDWVKFLGRAVLVQKRGFEIKVVMERGYSNEALFEDFKLILEKYNIDLLPAWVDQSSRKEDLSVFKGI